MSRTLQNAESPMSDVSENDIATAAMFGHRDDFVIDLTEAGRTRSFLRGHEQMVSPSPTRLHIARRTLDLTTASLALLMTSPLFLVAALASRLGSPGPVFFVQERVGRNGKIFRCYKFRSMHADADMRLQHLLTTDSQFRDAWLQDQKVDNDPRITPIGRFLRKTSLDELPQLINVLKGDMSIIGPRPVVPEETIRYGDALPLVLSVRPGVTGLWQVSGRNSLTYRERIALDLEYVEHQSIRLDAKVMVKTIATVMTGHGAS